MSATERANYPEEPRGVVKPHDVYIFPISVSKKPPKEALQGTQLRENPASGLVIGAESKGVVTLGVSGINRQIKQ